jgi:hypothetical protein
MTSDNNKNWDACPKCGLPVLIDSTTGQAEACSNCNAKSSALGLYLGGIALILGAIGVVFLVYICIQMIFR